MEIPFEPMIAGFKINVHMILEYLAFFVGYRYYAYLRKGTTDDISFDNRLVIILGAALGALIGSRVVGLLENPNGIAEATLVQLFNTKTVMGGIFGGLLGVEFAKLTIGEKRSSGDLFTLPIVLGIFIGRVGCFLMGINEFTYGAETDFFMGMDLGDGLMRHPLPLYELIFLVPFFVFLKKYDLRDHENGDTFKLFMVIYFGFRFLIEFLKPNTFFFLGLSSIQWLCVVCWLYYAQFIYKLRRLITN